MNALEVRELTKVYPEFTLDKVSFFVKQGHISGLIGRNGVGKSTTIKGILRLINAEGSVSVFGKDFLKEEMAVKQTIGYVGGGFRYYPMNTLAAIRKAYAPFYPTWNQSKYEKFLSLFELIENKKVSIPTDFKKHLDTISSNPVAKSTVTSQVAVLPPSSVVTVMVALADGA